MTIPYFQITTETDLLTNSTYPWNDPSFGGVHTADHGYTNEQLYGTTYLGAGYGLIATVNCVLPMGTGEWIVVWTISDTGMRGMAGPVGGPNQNWTYTDGRNYSQQSIPGSGWIAWQQVNADYSTVTPYGPYGITSFGKITLGPVYWFNLNASAPAHDGVWSYFKLNAEGQIVVMSQPDSETWYVQAVEALSTVGFWPDANAHMTFVHGQIDWSTGDVSWGAIEDVDLSKYILWGGHQFMFDGGFAYVNVPVPGRVRGTQSYVWTGSSYLEAPVTAGPITFTNGNGQTLTESSPIGFAPQNPACAILSPDHLLVMCEIPMWYPGDAFIGPWGEGNAFFYGVYSFDTGLILPDPPECYAFTFYQPQITILADDYFYQSGTSSQYTNEIVADCSSGTPVYLYGGGYCGGLITPYWRNGSKTYFMGFDQQSPYGIVGYIADTSQTVTSGGIYPLMAVMTKGSTEWVAPGNPGGGSPSFTSFQGIMWHEADQPSNGVGAFGIPTECVGFRAPPGGYQNFSGNLIYPDYNYGSANNAQTIWKFTPTDDGSLIDTPQVVYYDILGGSYNYATVDKSFSWANDQPSDYSTLPRIVFGDVKYPDLTVTLPNFYQWCPDTQDGFLAVGDSTRFWAGAVWTSRQPQWRIGGLILA
jgi:hypothetical protein